MVTPGGGLFGPGPDGPVPAPVTLINFPAVIARVPPEPKGTFIWCEVGARLTVCNGVAVGSTVILEVAEKKIKHKIKSWIILDQRVRFTLLVIA